MGLLDILQGDPSQASPYNAMFPSQLLQQLQELQLAKGQAPSPQDAAAYGSMGVDPSAMPMPVPPPSPFPDVQQPQQPQQPPAPPASGFGAGAAPFSFAGAGSNAPSPSQMAPPATPAPAPQAPAPQPAAPGPAPAPGPMNANAGPQNAPLPVGNVMMPRIGSGFPAPGADDGEDDETPAAKPAAAPAGPAPFSFGGVASNIGDRLEKAGRGFFGNMALGPIGALAGGLGALVTNKNTDPTAISQEKMNLTAQALAKKGASPDEIQAAAQNPELMKALLGQYFGKDKFQPVTTKDALGNETKSAFDTNTGEFKTAGSTGGAGAPGAGVSILAPGVKSYDANLSGDAYMAQFSPEVQAAAKSYMAGDVMPTGNARNNSIATLAKTIGQKYGQDTGQPVSDETYAAKRKMQVDLAGSSNSSMGGILSNGKSAFDHLATYSGKLADVGDYNGPDVPGGAIMADIGNFVGNKMLPTANTRDKISGANSAALKYGQESTKFYSGSGGGEGERMNALKNNDASSTTGAQQAGFLQSEKELILGRFQEKEAQIRDTLGDAYLQQHPVMTPQLKQTIATIDGNIAKLRGQAPAAPVASGTVNVGGKPIQWSVK